MEIIKFENVSYIYDLDNDDGENESLTAVDNVNLSIEEGQFIALCGHNGSGKSTLAKLINGLFIPTKGSVTAFNIKTDDEKRIYDIRVNIGMVFQNPDNQMIASIVEDDVAFGPENIGIEREEIIERVEWALKAVGMSEYRKATPFKMSGGQKQRIAIAGVLAIKPKVLVLDESTAMLDPQGRKEVLDVAHKLNKEEGMTIIHITHHMEETVYADRVLVMDKGKIVMDGTPQEIFSQPQEIEKYNLELPIVTKIQNQIVAQGIPINKFCRSEEELCEELCQLI